MELLSKLILIVALLISYIFFVPKKVLGFETYQQGQTLLFDDFNDGNFNGWLDEIGNGGWSVNNGNLLGVKTSALQSARLTQSGNWDNYSIEADINSNAGIDEGVGFRRADNLNAYEVTLRHGVGAYNTPEVLLRKTQAGTTTTLQSTHSIPLTNNKWYHLKVEAVQEHIQVWVDSTLAIEVNDTGTTVKTGPVSLSLWTGDSGISIIRFDNVKVTSLSKQLYPVIFIPGIGGSEFKAGQDIIWSQPDGHGGDYSHAYSNGEKIWVNQDEAIKLGDDDYFDVLRLKSDGVTSEADVRLTGSLTPFGYPDIDSFFQSLGYIKGVNFFVFPYDWRKDITSTQNDLDALVEKAKTTSGMPKANIVAHSMGGLVARYYISDASRASKINKLTSLGTPHLGSVEALKVVMYGKWLSYKIPLIPIFNIGIIPNTEIKELFSNLPGAFELQPNSEYYDFYTGSNPDLVYPFDDERDIDNNKETGALNFNQIKTLLSNLSFNMTVFGIFEKFQNFLIPSLNQSNGVKLYHIVGSGQPTLGQIREGWLINWPIKLIPKYDEIYINGDETVPLYSASLKSDKLDLSAGAKIYYVEQTHTDLTASTGPAMQTVKAILNEGDAIPVEVQSTKITLDGQQISVDQDLSLDLYDENGNHTGLNSNGEAEINIPNTFYNSIGNTKHVFVKKPGKKITVKAASSKKTKANVKIRHYTQDTISKTIIYKDVPTNEGSVVQFQIDPASDVPPVLDNSGQTVTETSEVIGDAASDYLPPTTTVLTQGDKDSSGNYIGSVTITLTASDKDSGVLRTEYSLDDGQSVNIYSQPFTISSPGTYNLQITSIDKAGNEELPQTITIIIVGQISQTTPTPQPTTTQTSNDGASSQTTPTPTSTTPLPITASTFSDLSGTIEPKDLLVSASVLGASTKASTPIKLALGEENVQEAYASALLQNAEPILAQDGQTMPDWLLLIPPFLQRGSPLTLMLFGTFLVRSILRKSIPK